MAMPPPHRKFSREALVTILDGVTLLHAVVHAIAHGAVGPMHFVPVFHIAAFIAFSIMVITHHTLVTATHFATHAITAFSLMGSTHNTPCTHTEHY
jgi:hypothetical protein